MKLAYENQATAALLRMPQRRADAVDLADIEAVSRRIASGETDVLPAEVVNRLLDGEQPVLVLRQYRGLTVSALADAACTSQSFVSEIEAGRKRGGVDTLMRIASALSVPLDLLVRPGDR